MEDAATVEICRGQLWQLIYHEAIRDDGRRSTAELFRSILKEERDKAFKEIASSSEPQNLIQPRLFSTSWRPTDNSQTSMLLLAYDLLE